MTKTKKKLLDLIWNSGMPTRTFTPLDMSPFSVCSAGSTTETIQVSPDVFLTTKDFHEIYVGHLDHYLLSVRKKNKKKRIK